MMSNEVAQSAKLLGELLEFDSHFCRDKVSLLNCKDSEKSYLRCCSLYSRLIQWEAQKKNKWYTLI